MEDEYFVPTRSSRALGAPAHQLVVHADANGGAVASGAPKSAKPTKKKDSNAFTDLDMKAARFEVYKFSQNSFTNVDKQKNQKELAIKLGAVPPKRKHTNYKVYKEEQKKLKKKEKEQKELVKLGAIHRPQRFTYKKPPGRNQKAQLRKKLSVGTGILKQYGTD